MNGLRRVPGAKRYRALAEGLTIIGRSSQMQDEVVAAAERIASRARAVGEDSYSASARAVTGGWNHEKRAGAVVSAGGESVTDAENRVLLAALGANTMAAQGPAGGKAAFNRARRAQQRRERRS